MGWSEGTELFWEEASDHSYTIMEKKKPEVTDTDTDVGC
jgi:hypothetical protein